MELFAKKPEPSEPVENVNYDVTGQLIWDLISEALDRRGFSLRRGTGTFGLDKWGDGRYHLRFQADKVVRPPSKIGIAIDGVPFPKAAWNALNDQQRLNLVTNHTVQFKPMADGDIEEIQG